MFTKSIVTFEPYLYNKIETEINTWRFCKNSSLARDFLAQGSQLALASY